MAGKLVVVLLLLVIVVCLLGVALHQVKVEEATGQGDGVVQEVMDNANQALEDGPVGAFFERVDNRE